MRPGHRGTALIMALVLLVALLLLGLPFVFSQSSSVSGIRSFGARARVELDRTSAQHAATAVTAEILAPSLVVPTPADGAWQSWSSLLIGSAGLPAPLTLGAGTAPLVAAPAAGQGSIRLTDRLFTILHLGPTARAPAGGVADTCGARITDAAGLFDANLLSAPAWQALLRAVGIGDWNDQRVYPNPGPMPPGGYPPGTYVPSADQLGQLAKALAALPGLLPGGRLTAVEQLLQADPQRPQGPSGPLWARLRWPLTHAELERLRPHLSLQSPPPGRGGCIDAGTVLRTDGAGGVWLDSNPDPLAPLYGIGTRVTTTREGIAGSVAIAGLRPGLALGDGLFQGLAYEVLTRVPGGPTPVTWAALQDTVVLEAPAAVNVHALSPAVRVALGAPGPALPVPLQAGQPQAVTRIADCWAVTGVTAPGLPVTTTNLSSWLSPIGSGIELPALGIASPGVVAIDSDAAVINPLGQVLARAGARTWVQAVPQERLLERRWLTQGDWWALIAGRWASRMQAWPLGSERLTDLPPDDHTGAAGDGLAVIPAATGVRPRPVVNEGEAWQLQDLGPRGLPLGMAEMAWPLEHCPMDWRVAFGAGTPVASAQLADAETFVPGMHTRAAPSGHVPPAAQLRPDGLHLAAGVTLAYPLQSVWQGASPRSALLLPRDASLELGARRIGLWVRPEQDWRTGLHPLLSVRMPAANAGLRLSGDPGNPACENWWQLTVDADAGLLLLVLAPPTVEATGDAGPLVGLPTPQDPALDAASLAQPTGVPLAADAYADHGAGLSAWSQAFARNRVLHYLRLPAQGGQPYFRGGGWYRIDVCQASDRPDGVVLLIDGCAGQPAALAPAAPAVDDQGAVPVVVLTTALPGGPVQSAADLYLARIGVEAPAGLTVAACLPAHGLVRIDDEYLSYSALDPAGALIGCMRARRQATVAGGTVGAFPTRQAHAAGALVCPGGYRLDLPATTPPGSRLYRGGCTLAEPVGLGDAAFATAPGATWTAATGQTLLPGGTLTVQPASGAWTSFPTQGLILVGSTAWRYRGKTAAALTGLTPIAADPSLRQAPAGTLPLTPVPPSGAVVAAGTPVLLAGIPLAGPDPLEDGRYVQQLLRPDGGRVASFQDVPGGGVEWIAYDGIASRGPGQGYLCSRTGFAHAQRGIGRTAMGVHPAGTLVLPVQTELSHVGHWMATGDTITLLPTAPTGDIPVHGPAVQLLVRFVATDAYPTDPAQTPTHGPADWVAFDRPIPDAVRDPTQAPGVGLACALWQIACGTCWSGADLSPALDASGRSAGSAQPRGCLPRLDLWSTGGGAQGIDAQVHVLADDPAVTSGVTTDATIDDLSAGGLTGSGPAADGHDSPGDTTMHAVRWFWIGGTCTGVLPATTPPEGAILECTTPLLRGSTGMVPALVWMDGEVLAVEPVSAADAATIATARAALAATLPGLAPLAAATIQSGGQFARIIGRGLLAEQPPRAHTCGSGDPRAEPVLADGMPHGAQLTAVRLPLGPVRLLDGALTDAWFGLLASDQEGVGATGWLPLRAPYALLCAPDGSARELVQCVGPRQPLLPGMPITPGPGQAYATAPWLRELYNTVRPSGHDWRGTAGQPRPVVIGWWPRYAPALHGGPDAIPAQLSSRTFPWIGCPVGVHGGYFDAGRISRLEPGVGATAAAIAVDPDPAFVIEARAQGAGIMGQARGVRDWSRSVPVRLPAGGSDPTDASMLETPAADGGATFSDGRRILPSDGFEVRLVWRYLRPPSNLLRDIAAAGGRAPTIRQVRVRYLAPIRVLASEPR